ncbi:MAG: DUF6519 domain-containing protein [Persicimonas sp.]
MKADISRSTFDARKDYSGVRMQQGRVQVDADWNEQLDIQRHRERTARGDIIGAAGVPRNGVDWEAGDRGGFEVTLADSDDELKLSPGRIYVDGILCELREDDDAAATVDPVGLGEESEGGIYLVYLDVWERDVHAGEDPSIVDPALLVPDTAVRSKVEWVVRAERLEDDAAPSPDACTDALEELLRGEDAVPRLSAFVDEGESSEGPCIIPSVAGYRGIENQLYRVEVHRGSGQAGAQPTFKWSRENGAAIFGVETLSNFEVSLRDEGVDGKFGLADNDLVEVVSVERESRGEQPGPMARIEKKPGKGPRAYELEVLDQPAAYNEIAQAFQPGDQVYLRRWDHGDAASLDEGGVALEEGVELELEHGVKVEFEAAERIYRSGDYWLVAARAANDRRGSGDVLWPSDPGDDEVPQFLPPEGVQHHYAPLCVVKVDADGPAYSLAAADEEASDCRKLFPPLTDIRATDVSYDNGECTRIEEASNVQEAIDELCHKINDTCEFVLRAGRDWRAELEAFVAGRQTVHICVPPETFVLDSPLVFEELETVRISGAGRESRFDAGSGRRALVFNECDHVEVLDVSVSAGVEDDSQKRRGALSFVDCVDVTVRDVDVACEGSWEEHTSCIYARFSHAEDAHNERASDIALEVSGCDLKVGHRQKGVMVLDAGRLRVEKNRIWVDPEDPAARVAELAKNASQRKQFIDRLFASPVEEFTEQPGPGKQSVRYSGHSVTFETDPNIFAKWGELVEAEQPEGIDSPGELLDELRELARAMIFDGEIPAVEDSDRWRFWVDRVRRGVEEHAYAVGGIVVAGQIAHRVRVVQNDIERAVRGVHVGLSDANTASGSLAADDVLISDNHIDVAVPYGYNRERHGIFVGNFGKLAIDGNRLELTQASGFFPGTCDGVRVYGRPGLHMTIKDNYATSFEPGIHTVFLQDNPEDKPWPAVWSVVDNLARCDLMRTPDPRTGEPIEVEHSRVHNVRNLS